MQHQSFESRFLSQRASEHDVARIRAGVAQLVEHLFCKQKVRGSIPLASSECCGVFTTSASYPKISRTLEGCPSGQREQAVNLPALASVGSNPTPSTTAGVAQLVERQPSKLNVEGSSPFSRSSKLSGRRIEPFSCSTSAAHLAQLVERVLGKDEVTSSILVVGSKRAKN